MNLQGIADNALPFNTALPEHGSRSVAVDARGTRGEGIDASADITALDSGSGTADAGSSLTGTAQGGIYQAIAFLIDLAAMVHAEAHGTGHNTPIDDEGRILADTQAIQRIAASVRFHASLPMNQPPGRDAPAISALTVAPSSSDCAAANGLAQRIAQRPEQAATAQANLSSPRVLALLAPTF